MSFLVKKRKSLTYKIFTPIIISIAVVILILFLFLHLLLADFIRTRVQVDMKNMAGAIYRIGDRSLVHLIETGRSDNEIAIKITKAKTQEMMHDFMRENDIAGIFFENKEEFFRSATLSAEIMRADLGPINHYQVTKFSEGNKNYYLYPLQFSPWQWDIVLVKETDYYSSLIEKFKAIYMGLFLLLVIGTVILLRHIRRQISIPVNEIISSLKNDLPPRYTGIYEFEFISSHTAEMMQSLNEINIKAQAANLAKSQFLANMSHEIRTPMNAIIGMNRLALEQAAAPNVRTYLETIQQSADHLLSILNDILDFSKIEAGQLDIVNRPFNVVELIKTISSSFAVSAAEKGVDISFIISDDIHPALIGDDHRLHQILSNLTSNAIKFTETGTITLECKMLEESSDEALLEFSVTDTGIGIPKDIQKHIFDEFKQADSGTSRIYGGTGLGLAICNRLVNLMEGQIWIQSHEGQGSSFFFTVKLKKSSLDEVKQDKNTDLKTLASGKAFNILVAEDNAFNMDLINIVLEQAGHSVYGVGNGLQAIEALNKHTFDVILMDVQMPVLDGFSATRMIRLSEEGKADQAEKFKDLLLEVQIKHQGRHMPIIAMTAHAMKGDHQRCIDCGMDEYLTKPLQTEELFSTLAQLTSKKDDYSSDSDPDKSISGLKTMKQSTTPLTLELVKRHLEEKYQLSPEVVENMLQSLKNSLTVEFAKATTALEKEDFSILAKAAHSIKGALKNAGADSWAEIAYQIEKQHVEEGENLNAGLKSLLKNLAIGISQLLVSSDKTQDN